jgi:hypothetical protein
MNPFRADQCPVANLECTSGLALIHQARARQAASKCTTTGTLWHVLPGTCCPECARQWPHSHFSQLMSHDFSVALFPAPPTQPDSTSPPATPCRFPIGPDEISPCTVHLSLMGRQVHQVQVGCFTLVPLWWRHELGLYVGR